jgi:cobalt-zinc-cadmium efflux system membrane fusion protein
MKFDRCVAAALLACSSLALASCRAHDAGDGAAEASVVHDGELLTVPEGSPLRQALVVQPVAKQQAQTPLQAPAVLEPDPSRVANVLPPLSGRISALFVHLGDEVKAGQPLFAIDSADLAQDRADLQHARIGVEQTRKALARQQDLYDHHIAAQKDLEQAQADSDNAQSEFERASAVFRSIGLAAETPAAGGSVRELVVRSPLAGRISTLTAVPGTYANDNTAALLTVSDVSTIWITASVQEKDLAQVQAGDAASATVQAYPGDSFTGTVRFVSDQLDSDTRTLKVRIAYDNKDGRLKPGMFAQVLFPGRPHAAVLVPLTALIQSGDQTVVYVESQPWKFEARPVVTGPRDGDSIEIVKGLDGGERIVARQGVLLND